MVDRPFARVGALTLATCIGLFKVGEVANNIWARQEPKSKDLSAGIIATRQGNDIYYRSLGVRGSKKLPTIICHGLGTSSTSTRMLADSLYYATTAPVTTYDRAGYRRSRYGSVYPYAPSEAVEDLRDLIEHTSGGQSPVNLVGHSFGGYIAYRLAHRYPNLVNSLCLLEPSHPREARDIASRRVGILTIDQMVRTNSFLSFFGTEVLRGKSIISAEAATSPYRKQLDAEVRTRRNWRAMRREWQAIAVMLLDGEASVDMPKDLICDVVASADAVEESPDQSRLWREYSGSQGQLHVIQDANHNSLVVDRNVVEQVVEVIVERQKGGPSV